jgi:hypothetical protein
MRVKEEAVLNRKEIEKSAESEKEMIERRTEIKKRMAEFRQVLFDCLNLIELCLSKNNNGIMIIFFRF